MVWESWTMDGNWDTWGKFEKLNEMEMVGKVQKWMKIKLVEVYFHC
jgi:hypothetical protein